MGWRLSEWEHMGEAVGADETTEGQKQSTKALQDQDENFGKGPHLNDDEGKQRSESFKGNLKKRVSESHRRTGPRTFW